jgi:hypothetical protein
MMTLQRMTRLARRLRQELIWGDTKLPLREEEFFWHLRYANSGMLHQGSHAILAEIHDAVSERCRRAQVA